MEELGFSADALQSIKSLMARPHGLFLVCGPTGSGKTTTLHSLLGSLNTPDLKIWTAEDPIEITQAGLRQVQVNAKIGWTFAAAMRSFMRADPDVIMVGEMRDSETCRIGIEASLTGHLVLSTLHTNSAAESVVRLLDLGMDPFNFADALLGVLAQRLVRKLCMQCRAKLEPTVRDMEALAAEYCEGTVLDPEKLLRQWREDKTVMYEAKGCKECDRTGYKGRLAVYELMVANPAVKRLIQTRSPVAEIMGAALAAGMRTLKQDGIDKVIKGHTDMQQIRAV
jgi:type II secretory ATPase GspE/PulE/Tfp pilus assembly ATPase PilB-like protein